MKTEHLGEWMDLTIDFGVAGGKSDIAYVSFTGEVNRYNQNFMERCVGDLVDRGFVKLAIDLEHLEQWYEQIPPLLGILKRLRAFGGLLFFTNISQEVASEWHDYGWIHFLPIEQDTKAAVALLESDTP